MKYVEFKSQSVMITFTLIIISKIKTIFPFLKTLSLCQTLQATLEANAAQIGLVLDQASRLRKVGVSSRLMDCLVCSVGVAILRLKQHLAAVQRRIENGRATTLHLMKLWKR